MVPAKRKADLKRLRITYTAEDVCPVAEAQKWLNCALLWGKHETWHGGKTTDKTIMTQTSCPLVADILNSKMAAIFSFSINIEEINKDSDEIHQKRVWCVTRPLTTHAPFTHYTAEDEICDVIHVM
jgi:hypothetical protein